MNPDNLDCTLGLALYGSSNASFLWVTHGAIFGIKVPILNPILPVEWAALLVKFNNGTPVGQTSLVDATPEGFDLNAK